jgi:hypothetical protein
MRPLIYSEVIIAEFSGEATAFREIWKSLQLQLSSQDTERGRRVVLTVRPLIPARGKEKNGQRLGLAGS